MVQITTKDILSIKKKNGKIHYKKHALELNRKVDREDRVLDILAFMICLKYPDIDADVNLHMIVNELEYETWCVLYLLTI